MPNKARVFISCGQRGEEADIAREIKTRLTDIGFEPYVAVEEQTLEGLKDNIFRHLHESEYLIFIDFKRERLDTPAEHRGSLFSNQELAIASYLDIEVLAFREIGVKSEDGILQAIQANPEEFTERDRLPDLVIEKVKEKKWNPRWRNELSLKESESYVPAFDVAANKNGRYYHIKVENLHARKMARDCVAYLEKVKRLDTGNETHLELVEFKWKGVNTDRVQIPQKKFRCLDAFHIYEDSQTTIHLGINYPFLVDYNGYLQDYSLTGPGLYELEYVIFSENFPPQEKHLYLN